MKQFVSFTHRVALKSCIAALALITSGSAHAQLPISEWTNYQQLAEQGAICSGFSSIMETQDVISDDIGRLWTERRKFGGALIRNAGRLETGTAPNADEINATIAVYRDWIFSNLVQSNEDLSGDEQSNAFLTGQDQIRQLLKLNCDDVFKQADKAILARFPELRNVASPQIGDGTSDKEKLAELLALNVNLNQQLAEAFAQIEALQQERANAGDTKTPSPEVKSIKLVKIETPLPRPEPTEPPATPAEPATVTQTPEDAAAPAPAAAQAAELVVEPIVKQIVEPIVEPIVEQVVKITSPVIKGLFTAQLGIFKSENSANDMILELKTSRPEIFKTTELVVTDYTYPSGTVLYQVMTKPIDRENAKNLCALLWTERIGCLIKSAR